MSKKIQFDQVECFQIPLNMVSRFPFSARDMSSPQSNDHVNELTDSIRKDGQRSPATFRPDPNNKGKFEGVDGQCRFEALKRAEIPHIMAFVKKLSDDECYAISFQSNFEEHKGDGVSGAWRGRKVNEIEEAFKLKEWMHKSKLSQRKIADLLGCNASWVNRRLLHLKNDRVSKEVQDAVVNKQLAVSNVAEIAKVPVNEQKELLDKTLLEYLNQKDLRLVTKLLENATPTEKKRIFETPIEDLKKQVKEAAAELMTPTVPVELGTDDEQALESVETNGKIGGLDAVPADEELMSKPSTEMFQVKCGCGSVSDITVDWINRSIEGAEKVERK